MLLDTLRAWRIPQQHYGMVALVLNVVIATHGHGHVSTLNKSCLTPQSASLCKFSLALLVARPLTELEKKIATRSGMCSVSAASC